VSDWARNDMKLGECLDHDYAVDRYLNVYQVVGGSLSECIAPAIRKYRVAREKVYLGGRGFGLVRTFEKYWPGVANIHNKRVYLADKKALMPVLTCSDAVRLLSPREGLERLLRRASDPLETTAVRLLEELSSHGIGLGRLGVTGSLMLGVHNPELSDIDLVVYDCRLLEAIEEIGVVSPFRGRKLWEWVGGNASRLGLPEEAVARLYNPARRGVFGRAEVSIIPVSTQPGWRRVPDMAGAQYMGEVQGVVKLEGCGCDYAYYPHVFRGRAAAGFKRFERGGGVVVVSYESLFSYMRPGTELASVRGEGYLLSDGQLAVLVGGREGPSHMLPLGP